MVLRGISVISKDRGCGFRDTVLLFYETIDAANRIVLSRLVFRVEEVFEKSAFWDTPRISVTLQLIKNVKK